MSTATYDGLTGDQLAQRLGLPLVDVHERTESTMDDAHALAAAGAAPGTLVIANEQTAGRGRSGTRWLGEPGASILCTLIERPQATDGLGVLSLRIGLEVAAAIESVAPVALKLKWPNDVYRGDAKLAGILVEARWRDEHLEWVALAIGLNIKAPADAPNAAELPGDVSRLALLGALIPAMRAAAAAHGPLTEAELATWRERDWLAGRRLRAPVAGTASGITATGELMVDAANGPQAIRSGTVELE